MTTNDDMPPVEALLFDVGGVLSRDRVEDKLADLSEVHGVSYQALLDAKDPIREAADRGAISDAEFWRRTLAAVGVAPADVDTAIEPYLAEVPGTLALARELRGRVRLAILSNDSRELSRARRDHHGLDEIFDPIIISAHVGLVKPSAAIYRYALERLQLPAERCLFIDNLSENVAAARRCGLHAVRFRGAQALRHDLRSFTLVPPGKTDDVAS